MNFRRLILLVSALLILSKTSIKPVKQRVHTFQDRQSLSANFGPCLLLVEIVDSSWVELHCMEVKAIENLVVVEQTPRVADCNSAVEYSRSSDQKTWLKHEHLLALDVSNLPFPCW